MSLTITNNFKVGDHIKHKNDGRYHGKITDFKVFMTMNGPLVFPCFKWRKEGSFFMIRDFVLYGKK